MSLDVCPNCRKPLVKARGNPGVYWACTSCGGRSSTIGLLRKTVPTAAVNRLWQTARSDNQPRTRACPACNADMARIPFEHAGRTESLDVCVRCQFVWFDPGEYASLPELAQPKGDRSELAAEARRKLAMIEVKAQREQADKVAWNDRSPDAWWQWIPGILGMPVERNPDPIRTLPLATWSLTILITVVSIIAFTDLQSTVQSLGLVPAQLGRYGGLTLLTSFFIHGGVLHLLSNMYFFLVFGDNVEDAIGSLRFLALLLLSILLGDILHIVADPRASTPCIGASGGISGVITYYALRFPHARLGFLFRIFLYFRWITMPAYAMLLAWIALQGLGAWAQVAGIGRVSAMAHLGGAAGGLIFWLITRKES